MITIITFYLSVSLVVRFVRNHHFTSTHELYRLSHVDVSLSGRCYFECYFVVAFSARQVLLSSLIVFLAT